MTALTFTRRARARRLSTGSTQRVYKSADGRYLVIEIRSAAGTYWLAGRQLVTGQSFIAKTRSRAAAEAACEQHRSA